MSFALPSACSAPKWSLPSKRRPHTANSCWPFAPLATRQTAPPSPPTPPTESHATVSCPSKAGGGRHTPFFNNYRPHFYFRTTDVTGVVTLPEGTEMVMPGDNTEMTVDLIQPIAMEEGLRFAIRKGGRTVGAGRVTKILK